MKQHPSNRPSFSSRKFLIAAFLIICLDVTSHAQYPYQRLNDTELKTAVAILGCTTETTNITLHGRTDVVTNDQWRTFGTGALLFVPFPNDKNSNSWITAVTARHNLFYIEAQKTNILNALYIKLNCPPASPTPKYLRVPLLTNPSTNFWISERGYDLAVIPLPPGLLAGNDNISFRTDEVVTSKNFRQRGILPGCPAIAVVLQLRYFDDTDFKVSQTVPIFTCGHLARLGLYSFSETNGFPREHVIDIHSSHGNSGATVITYAEDGSPMLLGIVQGFFQDPDAFMPYQAPVTRTSSVVLIDEQDAHTNAMAMTYLTEANPNLTLVTPVDELANLGSSPSFVEAASFLGRALSQYRIYDTYPFK